MSRIIPSIRDVPPGPHYAGDGYYWAVYRDGHCERTSRALRQVEVGAVGGSRYLCSLVGAGIQQPDPDCWECARRR